MNILINLVICIQLFEISAKVKNIFLKNDIWGCKMVHISKKMPCIHVIQLLHSRHFRELLDDICTPTNLSQRTLSWGAGIKTTVFIHVKLVIIHTLNFKCKKFENLSGHYNMHALNTHVMNYWVSAGHQQLLPHPVLIFQRNCYGNHANRARKVDFECVSKTEAKSTTSYNYYR